MPSGNSIRIRISTILLLLLILVVGVTALFLHSAKQNQQSAGVNQDGSGIRGLYLHAVNRVTSDDLTNPRSTDLQNLTGPGGENLSGLDLVIDWADVEPSPGHFDFSYFDKQLSALAALNKSRSPSEQVQALIGITFTNYFGENSWNPTDSPCLPGYGFPASTACPSVPSWLWNETQNEVTIITNDYEMRDACMPTKIPYPWDPVFISEWTKLVQAFGAWEAQSSEKNEVAGVILTALPYFNYSNQLPTVDYADRSKRETCTNKTVQGISIKIPDEIALWQAAGYKPSLVENSFQDIVNIYAKSFSGVRMKMETSEGALPPIDENGQVTQTDLSTDLVTIASSILGSRFTTLGNLSATNFDGLISAFSALPGTNVGYHLGWSVSNDPQCGVTKHTNLSTAPACESPAVMQEAYQENELGGATFFEVDTADLTDPDYQSINTAAREFLTSPSTGTSVIGSGENLGTAPWTSVHLAPAALPEEIQPPVTATGSPAVQFLREDAATTVHDASMNVPLSAGQFYAFTLWTQSSNRWIEIDADGNSAVYDPSDNTVESGASSAPGILGGQIFRDGNWLELTFVFKAIPGQNMIDVKLVDPSSGASSYQGDGRSGAYFWAPQIIQIQNPVQ